MARIIALYLLPVSNYIFPLPHSLIFNYTITLLWLLLQFYSAPKGYMLYVLISWNCYQIFRRGALKLARRSSKRRILKSRHLFHHVLSSSHISCFSFHISSLCVGLILKNPKTLESEGTSESIEIKPFRLFMYNSFLQNCCK